MMRWKADLDKWLRVSVRRRLLERDLDDLRHEMQGRVLEIGAGRNGRRGDFQPPVNGAEAWLYLDIHPRSRPDILCDLQHMAFTAGSFECMICLEVLEYVDEPQKALREMSRVLDGTGVLILSTPFLHRMDSAQDRWRFTEAGLRHMMEETGFRLRELRVQGYAMALVVNILKYAIHSLQSETWRMLWGAITYPPLSLLLWLDERLAKRIPVLQSFSTGYLLLAEVGR